MSKRKSFIDNFKEELEPVIMKTYKFSFAEKTDFDYKNSSLDVEANSLTEAIEIFKKKKIPFKNYSVKEI